MSLQELIVKTAVGADTALKDFEGLSRTHSDELCPR